MMVKRFYQYQHRTTIFHLKRFNNSKKATTYGVGNPGPGLGQAQRCGGIK